jgi:pyrimidine deaminase RibD-like protein
MLLLKKLPQGTPYPEITQVPISTYEDFLDTFRGGHTLNDNIEALTIVNTLPAAMLRVGIASGHLTKLKNLIEPRGLMDVFLSKSGTELIQTVMDRKFCEMAIAESKLSIFEDDGEPHPFVGVVIVKHGNVLAKGHRGESGEGDHGEYCALKKLNEEDLQESTVYTTLEPCTERNLPKKSCTERLIASNVERVVSGMPDKDETVYGHSTLVEAGIEIDFFPPDLMQELLAINKGWSDSRRAKQGVPPSNHTPALGNVSYYEPGTSMADNTHFSAHSPDQIGGFFTVQDVNKKVLAHARTIEEIAMEWHRLDDHKIIMEKLVRQGSGSSHRYFNLP